MVALVKAMAAAVAVVLREMVVVVGQVAAAAAAAAVVTAAVGAVAVMEEGRLAEHGAPLDLLSNSAGAFCKLVDELDAKSAAEIRALAREAAQLPQLAPSDGHGQVAQ